MRVGDLVLLSGSWDTFKSTLAMELAWSLATGRPWLGRAEFRVHRRLRLGILQTEIDPGAYDERCQRFPPAADLYVASVMDFTFDRLDELETAIDDAALDGLILDPLGQCWPSHSEAGEPFNENNKTHVSPVMRRLKALRKTIILVHHDPKPSGDGPVNRASGSAALLNDPDVRMFVDRSAGTGDIKVTVRNRLQQPTPPFRGHFDEESLRILGSALVTEPPKQRPRKQNVRR